MNKNIDVARSYGSTLAEPTVRVKEMVHVKTEPLPPTKPLKPVRVSTETITIRKEVELIDICDTDEEDNKNFIDDSLPDEAFSNISSQEWCSFV